MSLEKGARRKKKMVLGNDDTTHFKPETDVLLRELTFAEYRPNIEIAE